MAILDYKFWLLSCIPSPPLPLATTPPNTLNLIIITKPGAGAVIVFLPTLVSAFSYPKVSTLFLVAQPCVFANSHRPLNLPQQRPQIRTLFPHRRPDIFRHG